MPFNRQFHDGGAALARDADQCDVIEGGGVLADEGRAHTGAWFCRISVLVDGRQGSGQVRDIYLGQESESAEVHAEHWGMAVARQPHRPQHGAVSA